MGMTMGVDLSAAASRVSQSLSKPGAVVNAADASSTGTAAASGTSSTGTASTSAAGSSTITSNDFLTLLVTEMKNQDPTQPTDPNAYIQQLVGVNSLQQLISINQDLSNTGTGTSTGSGSGTNGAIAGTSGTSL